MVKFARANPESLKREETGSRLVAIAKKVLPESFVAMNLLDWVFVSDTNQNGDLGLSIFPYKGGEIKVHSREYRELAIKLAKRYEKEGALRDVTIREMYRE
jgi:hypothetical protein